MNLSLRPGGAYGGAVGFIGYNGDLDLAITIRTIEIEGDTTSIQAGAGIVADSDPLMEFKETQNKAEGMKRALELAAAKLVLAPTGKAASNIAAPLASK